MEIPKTQENIKLFELKKDSLSEEKEGQKNPSDSLKMEILQTAEGSKKKKKVPKSMKMSTEYSQTSLAKMMAGRVFPQHFNKLHTGDRVRGVL